MAIASACDFRPRAQADTTSTVSARRLRVRLEVGALGDSEGTQTRRRRAWPRGRVAVEAASAASECRSGWLGGSSAGSALPRSRSNPTILSLWGSGLSATFTFKPTESRWSIEHHDLIVSGPLQVTGPDHTTPIIKHNKNRVTHSSSSMRDIGWGLRNLLNHPGLAPIQPVAKPTPILPYNMLPCVHQNRWGSNQYCHSCLPVRIVNC